ncbi:hypothetical protein MRX96_033425 [Rhipicephalus microplus]
MAGSATTPWSAGDASSSGVSCASAARCCQLASGRATEQPATPDRRATDPVAVATSSRHGEGSGDSTAAVLRAIRLHGSLLSAAAFAGRVGQA